MQQIVKQSTVNHLLQAILYDSLFNDMLGSLFTALDSWSKKKKKEKTTVFGVQFTVNSNSANFTWKQFQVSDSFGTF